MMPRRINPLAVFSLTMAAAATTGDSPVFDRDAVAGHFEHRMARALRRREQKEAAAKACIAKAEAKRARRRARNLAQGEARDGGADG